MPTLPAVIVTLLLPFEHLAPWEHPVSRQTTVSSALGQHGDFAVYHHDSTAPNGRHCN